MPALARRGIGTSVLDRAELLYSARRRRDRAFGAYADLLGEPVWDMLLDMYIAHCGGRAESVTSVALAGCAPITTGLRWIYALEERRLIERVPDQTDRRRSFLRLTPAGVSLMEAALRI